PFRAGRRHAAADRDVQRGAHAAGPGQPSPGAVRGRGARDRVARRLGGRPPRARPARPKRAPARTPVDRLRAICLALPETTEKLAWGEPTWRVGGRLFAQLAAHHPGPDPLARWLPAALGEQEAMLFTNPARFFRPPYVGPRGWVGVRIDRRPNWTQVATLAEKAYRQ